MSSWSGDLYRDIGRNWGGVGLLYLFVLRVVLCIPTVVKIQIGFSNWVDKDAPQVVDKIPRITITKGEVSTTVETPYFIPYPQNWGTQKGEDMRYFAVIDLTGKYNSMEGLNTSILLTKKTASLHQSASETRTYDLSGVQSFWLDSDRVKGWLETAKYTLAPTLYVFVVLFSFVYRIVQVAFYAAIGLLVVKWRKAGLGYADLMRLSAVAVTPAVVSNELVDWFGIHVPYWSLICFVIAMGYLLFAVNANATTDTGPPPQAAGA